MINLIASLIIALCLMTPLSARAATLFLDTDSSSVTTGDTVVVNVRLDTGGQRINTIDAKIALETEAVELPIQEFSLANSVLTAWALRPSLGTEADNQKVISFVGGVPGGIKATNAVLFKIIINPKELGDLTLRPTSSLAYLNDGKGTVAELVLQNLVINVLAKKDGDPTHDAWRELIASDNIAPEPFEITLHQDPTALSGAKFIDFYTTDMQSGIDYYTVTEAELEPVRSGSPYILQQQANEQLKITVTAYDKAGNARVASYQSSPSVQNLVTQAITETVTKTSFKGWIVLAVIVLSLILIAWLVIRLRPKK